MVMNDIDAVIAESGKERIDGEGWSHPQRQPDRHKKSSHTNSG